MTTYCLSEIEHAESPREEPQAEWVYYVMSRPNNSNKVSFCASFDTEKEARNYCENGELDSDIYYCYVKVCRRKEQL